MCTSAVRTASSKATSRNHFSECRRFPDWDRLTFCRVPREFPRRVCRLADRSYRWRLWFLQESSGKHTLITNYLLKWALEFSSWTPPKQVSCGPPRKWAVKIHQRGGAVETGCSDLYDVIYDFYSIMLPHPLHPPPTAPHCNEYPSRDTSGSGSGAQAVARPPSRLYERIVTINWNWIYSNGLQCTITHYNTCNQYTMTDIHCIILLYCTIT